MVGKPGPDQEREDSRTREDGGTGSEPTALSVNDSRPAEFLASLLGGSTRAPGETRSQQAPRTRGDQPAPGALLHGRKWTTPRAPGSPPPRGTETGDAASGVRPPRTRVGRAGASCAGERPRSAPRGTAESGNKQDRNGVALVHLVEQAQDDQRHPSDRPADVQEKVGEEITALRRLAALPETP